MKFFKYFLVICLLLVASSAFASSKTIDAGDLSETQQAELALKAAQMKEAATKATSVPSIDKAAEWVELGSNVAKAITSAAKEVGVAADAFLNTTTGKITAGLIVYKIMGKDIINLAVGLMLFIVFVPLWIYFFRRLCIVNVIKVTKYEKGKGPDGAIKVKEYETPKDDATLQVTKWVMIILLVVGLFFDITIMLP